jgi:nucleoside-diphosphate-sugar epimerase
MSRILVIGANGALGEKTLRAIGPERGVAVTRMDQYHDAAFDHVRLRDGRLPDGSLNGAVAIVNAAGRVRADEAALREANVDLPTVLARQARYAGLAKFVQVSSFSVYGHAEKVDETTPLAPVTNYGRSKAAGDAALMKLATPQFAVECVRLPFLFDALHPALIGTLLNGVQKLPLWPVSPDTIERSMISYDDSGYLLAEAATTERSGISHAADTQLFDFALLWRIIAEETDRAIRLIRVPRAGIAVIDRIAPAISRRLFRSNVLAAHANLATGRELPVGIEATIRQIVQNRVNCDRRTD